MTDNAPLSKQGLPRVEVVMTASEMFEKTAVAGSTTNISAVVSDEFANTTVPARIGDTESHGTGVPGVVSAPRSRRGDGRRRQRKETESAANDRSPWLNAEQAADYLALRSRKALYEIVRQGRLPFYRWGHNLRFRREELDAAIAAGRMEPARYQRRENGNEPSGDLPQDGSCADAGQGYDRVDAQLQREGGK